MGKMKEKKHWTEDDDELSTVLSLWLGVQRDKIDRRVVDMDADLPWDLFDPEIRRYLDGLEVDRLGEASSREAAVLLALQLSALVEVGRTTLEQASSSFASSTGHPADFLVEVVEACIHEIRLQAEREYPEVSVEDEDEDEPRMLDCGEHGKSEWKGTVVCEDCEAVWQAMDEDAPRYAPAVCTCGAQLMPDPLKPKGADETWSARPICTSCFERRVAVLVASADPPRA